MSKTIVQPSKAVLLECSIGGLNFISRQGGPNFHVQELRIYEDVCKAYFTGQLVIETQLNVSELFLNPGSEVIISFEAPRSDGKSQRTRVYTERFRVYSYESKPREGDVVATMVITISLIGDEYYNDKANTVQQNFSNTTGTAAAAEIHASYIGQNGGLRIGVPSLGMIGMTEYPHQVLNKKPFKAIHDILDKSVFAGFKSCAPMYFRNKPGYVMAPLEALLVGAPITNNLKHMPVQGASLNELAFGYDNVIHFRPMSPAGEDSGGGGGGVRAAEIDSFFKKASFFDVKSGNYLTNALSKFSAIGNISAAIRGKVKGKYGGRHIFTALDETRQTRSVDKNGPGGYNTAEEALLARITYSEKYWVSVPLQAGINTTCGDRINVLYEIGIRPRPVKVQKTLFVPRLIHELRFTEGPNRDQVTVTGTTDMYCVHW